MGCPPCCCGSLENWTKVVAILQIIKASISLLDDVFMLAFGSAIVLVPPITKVQPAAIVFIILEEIRTLGKCWVWLVVQAVFMLSAIILFLAGLTVLNVDNVANLIGGAGLIFNAYCIWIVYAFVIELRGEDLAQRIGLGQAYHDQKV
ncbi:hypothetical protein Fcan01_15836 [Folsomia candida]|uniref:Uncharacterized protein n=1 Tax=Folsomia candida TaxID=158441 RepID=A0A226DXC5_FOLCA|nr:hypothetical protein Fcan01_15836 [Folsomia candida]